MAKEIIGTVGVAIIGCGLIGRKRALALGPARLIACADIEIERARELARLHCASRATTDWQSVLSRDDVDVVIVSTTNHVLAEIALKALEAGKHVLVEKPAARRVSELDPLVHISRDTGLQVRVGFNHRYHLAVRKARSIYEAGEIGELMFIRGRYGHGGRVGYEREWRADPVLSGGGELMDQGIHLIDLARWFLGDFHSATGSTHTYFWDMPVEDNAFMLLKTTRQQTAFLHVSCTEWKNLFSMEIYGRTGKLHIEGLGGSYGVERLAFYRMLPEMGPPETQIWEYPMADLSWHMEFLEFLEDVRLGRTPSAGLADARAALTIIEQLYRGSAHDYRP